MGAVVREAPDRRGATLTPRLQGKLDRCPGQSVPLGWAVTWEVLTLLEEWKSPCLSAWPGLGAGVTPASCPQCELDPGHPHRLPDLSFRWRPGPWAPAAGAALVKARTLAWGVFPFHSLLFSAQPLPAAPEESGGDESVPEALPQSSCHLWPQKRIRLPRAETARVASPLVSNPSREPGGPSSSFQANPPNPCLSCPPPPPTTPCNPA